MTRVDNYAKKVVLPINRPHQLISDGEHILHGPIISFFYDTLEAYFMQYPVDSKTRCSIFCTISDNMQICKLYMYLLQALTDTIIKKNRYAFRIFFSHALWCIYLFIISCPNIMTSCQWWNAVYKGLGSHHEHRLKTCLSRKPNN